MSSSSEGVPRVTPNNHPDREPQSVRNNNRNRNRNGQRARVKFEGEIPALKDYVYDVGGAARGSTDDFHRTTMKIAEYFSRENAGAGEFGNALDPDVLEFEPLTAPVYPQNSAAPDFEELLNLWKMDIKDYCYKLNTRTELIKRAHSVVIGQCSPALRDCLEAHASFKAIKASLNKNKDLFYVAAQHWHAQEGHEDID
jgi:hypothetical protein